MAAQDALVEQDQTKKLRLLALSEQCRFANEVALGFEVDGPGKPGIERRDGP